MFVGSHDKHICKAWTVSNEEEHEIVTLIFRILSQQIYCNLKFTQPIVLPNTCLAYTQLITRESRNKIGCLDDRKFVCCIFVTSVLEIDRRDIIILVLIRNTGLYIWARYVNPFISLIWESLAWWRLSLYWDGTQVICFGYKCARMIFSPRWCK